MVAGVSESHPKLPPFVLIVVRGKKKKNPTPVIASSNSFEVDIFGKSGIILFMQEIIQAGEWRPSVVVVSKCFGLPAEDSTPKGRRKREDLWRCGQG